MRKVIALVAVALAVLLGAEGAQARVVINVDKSQQRMTVSVDGIARHSWAVSTGRANFGTPSGVFAPQRLARTWFSKKYYDSPMPYSIFFHRGYAIHGSYEISRLGGPASHGCIRLHPRNAATLFALVQAAGAGRTTIAVSGENPPAGRRSVPAEVRYREPVRVHGASVSPERSYRVAPREFKRRGVVDRDRDGWVYWGGGPGWR